MWCFFMLIYKKWRKVKIMQEIEVGKVYKHYKGNIYKIIALGKHSENCEEMVVYQSIKDGAVWIRPKSMWNDKIDDDTLRFTLMDEV